MYHPLINSGFFEVARRLQYPHPPPHEPFMSRLHLLHQRAERDAVPQIELPAEIADSLQNVCSSQDIQLLLQPGKLFRPIELIDQTVYFACHGLNNLARTWDIISRTARRLLF